MIKKHQTDQVEVHSTKHLSPVVVYGVNVLNVKDRLRKTLLLWRLERHDNLMEYVILDLVKLQWCLQITG